MPSVRKLIAVPETIWSARSETANTACTRPVTRARADADDHAPDPAAGHVGAPDAEERAHQHHALEADVHDARALRRHAAERRERERRRVAQRGRQQRRPDHDALEVRLARVDRAVSARHARPGRPRRRPSRRASRPRAGPRRRARRRRARARSTAPACARAAAEARCRTRARRARLPPSRSTRRARRALAARADATRRCRGRGGRRRGLIGDACSSGAQLSRLGHLAPPPSARATASSRARAPRRRERSGPG